MNKDKVIAYNDNITDDNQVTNKRVIEESTIETIMKNEGEY